MVAERVSKIAFGQNITVERSSVAKNFSVERSRVVNHSSLLEVFEAGRAAVEVAQS